MSACKKCETKGIKGGRWFNCIVCLFIRAWATATSPDLLRIDSEMTRGMFRPKYATDGYWDAEQNRGPHDKLWAFDPISW